MAMRPIDFIMSDDVMPEVCKMFNIQNKAIQRLEIGMEVGHPVVVSMEYRPIKKRRNRKQRPLGFAGQPKSKDE